MDTNSDNHITLDELIAAWQQYCEVECEGVTATEGCECWDYDMSELLGIYDNKDGVSDDRWCFDEFLAFYADMEAGTIPWPEDDTNPDDDGTNPDDDGTNPDDDGTNPDGGDGDDGSDDTTPEPGSVEFYFDICHDPAAESPDMITFDELDSCFHYLCMTVSCNDDVETDCECWDQDA